MKTALGIALLLLLTAVDVHRSLDRYWRESMANPTGATDWQDQIRIGLTTPDENLEKLQTCLGCRVGYFYRQVAAAIEHGQNPLTLKPKDADRIREWSFALGLALSQHKRSLSFLAELSDADSLFIIDGWAFNEISLNGYEPTHQACVREFAGLRRRVCEFGAGRGSAAYPLRLHDLQTVPRDFIAGYREAVEPKSCQRGPHPLYCIVPN